MKLVVAVVNPYDLMVKGSRELMFFVKHISKTIKQPSSNNIFSIIFKKV